MKKEDVYGLCRNAGKKYQLDAFLLQAICEQESSYISDAVRLENGFYRKYIRPMSISPVVEILLASSYGLMQTMGESLRVIGWLHTENAIAVMLSIEAYLTDPALQVDCGAKWFVRKLAAAGGNVEKALCFWNGDMTGKYSGEVLKRRTMLAGEKSLQDMKGIDHV